MGAGNAQALDLWRAMLWPAQWDLELVGALQPALQAVLPRIHDGPDKLAPRISEWIAAILILAPEALEPRTITAFFGAADAEALEQVARVFRESLESAGERSPRQWSDRLKPIFRDSWPADVAKRSHRLSEVLVEIAIAARDAFPDAIETFERKGLIVRGSASDIISDLSEQRQDNAFYNVVANHPAEALAVLDLSVNEHLEPWNFRALREILDRIVNLAPALANNPRLVRLRELTERG
jgi:hypothetical protein